MTHFVPDPPDELTDAQLAVLAAHPGPRREAAFETLVRRHASHVHRLASGLVGPGAADDVVQEVLIGVYRNLSGFRAEAQFSTWLHRVTLNACHKALAARVNLSLDDAPEPAAPHSPARAGEQMLADTGKVQKNVSKYRAGARYPEGRFAARLQDAARLIAAGTGQRVLYVSLGGFDTHAGQRAEQDELLGELALGLAAFQADLETQGLAERVIVMGFSEFGRRVAENASAGTDHGQGGVMFALGRGVQGGVHGDSPDLENLEGGDIRYRQDFRGVYAGALTRWLGLDARSILGGDFAGPPWVA